MNVDRVEHVEQTGSTIVLEQLLLLMNCRTCTSRGRTSSQKIQIVSPQVSMRNANRYLDVENTTNAVLHFLPFLLIDKE